MTDREREELRSQVERLQEALQHLLNWVPEPYSGDWDTPRGRAIEAARGLIQNVSRGRNMTDRYWEGYRDSAADMRDIAERLEAEFGPLWDRVEHSGIELNAPDATVLRDLGREAAQKIRELTQ